MHVSKSVNACCWRGLGACALTDDCAFATVQVLVESVYPTKAPCIPKGGKPAKQSTSPPTPSPRYASARNSCPSVAGRFRGVPVTCVGVIVFVPRDVFGEFSARSTDARADARSLVLLNPDGHLVLQLLLAQDDVDFVLETFNSLQLCWTQAELN